MSSMAMLLAKQLLASSCCLYSFSTMKLDIGPDAKKEITHSMSQSNFDISGAECHDRRSRFSVGIAKNLFSAGKETVETIKGHYPSLRLRAVTCFKGNPICGIPNWL